MDFTSLTTEIVILFIVMLIGVVCQKLRLMTDAAQEALSALVIKVACPAMIIISMQREFSQELAHNSFMLILISAIAYLSLIPVLELWRKKSKKPQEDLGALQFLFYFGNVSFMGFPVLNAVYGGVGIFYAAMFNLIYFFLLFSYGIYIVRRLPLKGFLKELLNPGLLASVIGLILFLAKSTLPHVINAPIAMIGDLAIPLSLLIVGSSLGKTKIRDVIFSAELWVITLFKMVALPLLVFFVLRLFHLNEILTVVPTVILAMPGALTAGAFVTTYGGNGDLANRGVVLSNIFAVAAIPAVLWVVTYFAG